MINEFISKIEEASKVLVNIPNFIESIKNTMDVQDQIASMQIESVYDNKKLCYEYILNRLSKLGIYLDQESYEILMSNDCTEKDARRVFCENGQPNLPPVRFKRLWSILRSNKDQDNNQNCYDNDFIYNELKNGILDIKNVISDKPYGQWKDKELIEAYNLNCDEEIISVLKQRSNNRPFIVFMDEENGIVDIEISLRMLREARRRETPVNYQVADSLKRLYVVGEFPNLFYYESPFYPGFLLIDGYCDKSKITWKDISYECMQFGRIAFECGEVDNGRISQKQLFLIALQSGIDGLIKNYPESALLYKEFKIDNKLPNLKVRVSDNNYNDSLADPFNSNKRRF